MKLIGTLDRLDTNLDWITKFSVQTEGGDTVWLGARTKNQGALCAALADQEGMAPQDRPAWEIEYEESESTGKNGKTYTNRDVVTAKTVEASRAEPDKTSVQGGDTNDRINRSVALKAAVDLVIGTQGKKAIDPVALVPTISDLTNGLELILNRMSPEGVEAVVDAPAENNKKMNSSDEMFEEI